jgi:hypothetical protein
MALILHSQKMWEELAEDPFRGLRAGPATFSPFCFLPPANPNKAFEMSNRAIRRSTRIEENTKLLGDFDELAS